jgi:hypothetical protein
LTFYGPAIFFPIFKRFLTVLNSSKRLLTVILKI